MQKSWLNTHTYMSTCMYVQTYTIQGQTHRSTFISRFAHGHVSARAETQYTCAHTHTQTHAQALLLEGGPQAAVATHQRGYQAGETHTPLPLHYSCWRHLHGDKLVGKGVHPTFLPAWSWVTAVPSLQAKQDAQTPIRNSGPHLGLQKQKLWESASFGS